MKDRRALFDTQCLSLTEEWLSQDVEPIQSTGREVYVPLVTSLGARNDSCKAPEVNSSCYPQCDLQGPSVTPRLVAVHLGTAQIPPTFLCNSFYPINSDLKFVPALASPMSLQHIQSEIESERENEIGAQCSPT